MAPKEQRVVELEVQILKAELKRVENTAPKRLLDDFRKTIAAREASLTRFKARHFYVVAFKELGYEIHGHKSQIGLIERAANVGLKDVVRELEEQDQFWIEERARWDERQRFGGYRKSDPEVAEAAAWDDEVRTIGTELKSLEARQIVVRCEGGLRRAEDLGPFREEAEKDKRAFYPDLVPSYVGDARLLRRGDVLEPGRLVRRGFPEFFGGGTPDIESSGRLELANWLTKPGTIQSALVARTAVNRAWQHLFGEGLCRTPKELGRLGETPEMPELIDGLAVRFINNRWSLKSVIREIVTSRAYRRSALADGDTMQRDPENRFFARQSVRRLACEPIMNTMAYLRHGARFDDLRSRNSRLAGYQQYLQLFDGPTTDDLIDRRVASISATQALFLMNNNSTTRAIATDLSARLFKGKSPTLGDVLSEIYTIVLQRPPTKEESTFAAGFIDRRRRQTGVTNYHAEIREFIQLLLCGNQLIYLE